MLEYFSSPYNEIFIHELSLLKLNSCEKKNLTKTFWNHLKFFIAFNNANIFESVAEMNAIKNFNNFFEKNSFLKKKFVKKIHNLKEKKI